MSHIFKFRNLKEEDIKAIGGFSESDRYIRDIEAIADVAAVAVPRFREAMQGARGARKWWDAARTACSSMREANSETALGFLLRKGLQVVANDWYTMTETAWREYALVSGSDNVAEWYAPLYGTTIAGRVERNGKFPESRIIGENSHLVNQKFGLVQSVERELFDDDQSGQIRDRARALGESMAITESVWASSRFLGPERTYANLTVPASSYSTTDINGTAVTTPFSTTLYGASLGNRPSTYGVLNMGNLKVAYQTCLKAVDPLQNKINVTPNRLLVSPDDKINAELLTAQGYYPAIMGQSNLALANNAVLGGTSATAGTSQGVLAGFPGGPMSQNPFGGLGWKVAVERYLTSWAWALLEAGKGFIFQERDPLEIIQEAPNSGAYFTADAVQWRSRRRFEADWVGGGSRFAFLGNDGTVTGNN